MSDGYTNTKARPHVAPEYLGKGREEGKKKRKKRKNALHLFLFLVVISPAKPMNSLDEH